MQETEKTVFVGARIVTLDERQPEAESLCASNGRIDCVGSRKDVLRWVGPQLHRVVDLGGGVLYPGFIDTHSHLSSYSAYLDWIHCGPQCGDVPGVLERLRAAAAETAGEWVLGCAYDDTGLPEQRHLDRRDLDAVSADRPVFVSHISIHMGYANTRALELLGYAQGADIPGGTVVTDESGAPTGLLLENAFFRAQDMLPQPSPARIRGNMVRAMADYASRGFTTIMDGGVGINGGTREFFDAYMDICRDGRMDIRAYLQLMPAEMDAVLSCGLHNFGGDFMRIGGVKLFADGSIQGYTAALREDYHNRPGQRGALIRSAEELSEIVARYHDLGVQVAVHANGDAAAEAVIRAFEEAAARRPGMDLRHMLVHAQTVSDEQLMRMCACGVIPTFFVRHVEVWGDRHMLLFLGPERAARLDPCGSAARMGMAFGLHVDSPVLPPTALGSMHAAVNRITSGGMPLGEDQRISPRQALLAYTKYAALCCRGEHDRGCLAPGRLADFVLLDNDIEAVGHASIRDIKVLATVCGGRMVYGG